MLIVVWGLRYALSCAGIFSCSTFRGVIFLLVCPFCCHLSFISLCLFSFHSYVILVPTFFFSLFSFFSHLSLSHLFLHLFASQYLCVFFSPSHLLGLSFSFYVSLFASSFLSCSVFIPFSFVFLLIVHSSYLLYLSFIF